MKLTCDIVQDLLPLYEDGVCSPDSRAAVEEHLKTCAACRGKSEIARTLPDQEIVLNVPEEQKTVQSLKKVRRRWIASLLVVALIFPMALMTFNQVYGMGICFTNLDEIRLAKYFISCIQKGEYSRAAEMYDFHADYQDILEVQDSSPENYIPRFHQCKIGGEIWYINDTIADYIQPGNDANSVWTQLIFNGHSGVLIPKEQMEQLAAREPGAVSYEHDGYTVNGSTYLPYDTPWGQFLIEMSDLDGFLQSDKELEDYGYHFTLIPEEMYLDVLPALQADAESLHNKTIEIYSGVLNMTEEEFCTHMQKKYAAELENAFSQVTMTGNRYTTSYRIHSSSYDASECVWTVGIQSTITHKDFPITIYLSIRRGKVTSLSLSYAEDSPLSDLISEALFPSYYD